MVTNRSGDGVDDYREAETFSPGSPTTVASSGAFVVFGSGEGRLDVVTREERHRISTDEPVHDVAASRYAFALFDGRVGAYATGGMELWSQETPDATAIVAPGSDGILCVVTDGGELVGLDVETGNEWYRTERPHADVSDLSAVVGGHGRVALAAWSFLTCLDYRGEPVFDRSFDGVVESVGLTPGQVVVVLKNGLSVGLDPETGDEVWSHTRDSTAVAPVGDRSIPVVTADGVAAIDDAGTYERLDVEAGETVATAPDASVICSATAGTVTVYRPDADPLADVTGRVLSESVRAEQSLRVALENEGDHPVSFALAVDPGAAATTTSGRRQVDLDTGDHVEYGFPVTEITRPGESTVTVTADDDPLATGSVRFEESTDVTDLVTTRSGLEAVDGDVVRWRGTVENVGDVPLEVTWGDETTTVEPGDTTGNTFESAYEPGTRVEDTVHLETEYGHADVSLGVVGPDQPLSMTVESDDTGSRPYIDVELHNGLDVPVTDEVTITIGETLERCRTYEFGPGTTTVVSVPLSDPPDGAFRVSVACADTGLVEQRQLSGVTAPDPRSIGANAPPENGSTDDTRAQPAPDTRSDRAERGAPATDQSPKRHPSGSERSDDDSTARRSETTDRSDPVGGTDPSMTVDRDLPASGLAGLTVTEEVTVSAGDERVANVTLDHEEVSADIEPRGTATLQRYHVFYETGVRTVPGGEVRAASAETSLPDGTVEVEAGPVVPRFVVERGYDDATLLFKLTNASGQPCTVNLLGIQASGSWVQYEVEDRRVVDGDTLTLERRVDPDRLTDDSTLLAGVKYRIGDGSEQSCTSLATVREVGGSGFTYEIVEGSSVTTSDRGMIALTVTNQTGRKVTNVEVTASGPAVDGNPMYEPSEIDVIEPGATETAELDVDSVDELALDVVVTGVGDGESVEDEVRVSGPVPADPERWASDLLDEWTVEGNEADQRTDWPNHLRTEYERAE